MNKRLMKRVGALSLAAVMMMGVLPGQGKAAASELDYVIANPYETVDWGTYDQYKADFHAHSRNSDGGNLTYEMVEDHYAKGYDILAMTDHNYTTRGWENAHQGPVTIERKAEIEAGVGRDGRGMLDFSYSNEQSRTDHINTFLTDWNNSSGATMANTLATIEAMGGFSHINHMGRYTGYRNPENSNDPVQIAKYVDLLDAYRSCVGVEIINKIDNESRYDRILWDNILKELMPVGRNVWGFSNDDTHSLNATGYSFNMMLMPELSIPATRTAMENGTFYAVSRVSRVDGINATLPDGSEMRGSGNSSTLYLLEQSTPSISNILVDQDENSIEIEGADYKTVEWIADGKVIATGNAIDLNDYEDQINSYVRAQLKSDTGIAFTQPFGVTLQEYPVNLNVTKDDEPWTEGAPEITVGATPETAVENGGSLPNGTYNIYEDGEDTGRDITVDGYEAKQNLSYYTLDVVGNKGIASTEGSGVYLKGEKVTISATMKPRYMWAGWKSSNSALMRSSNNRTYTFEMPGGTLTMTGNARGR